MPTGRPIGPAEARRASGTSFPGAVFDVFNELLARGAGAEVVIKQLEVADEVAKRLNLTRAEVFERNLLDVERAYEAEGWRVTYDKPGYSESYPAAWTFTPKVVRRG